MGFFKNKEEMFNHRAERFEREAERYAEMGNSDKERWAREQQQENLEKANKYKGQEGW